MEVVLVVVVAVLVAAALVVDIREVVVDWVVHEEEDTLEVDMEVDHPTEEEDNPTAVLEDHPMVEEDNLTEEVAARAVDRALGSRVAAGPTGNAIANKISQMYGSNNKATGYCARAVRTAIEAATGKTIQRTQSAKNYGPNLEKAGFRKVSGPPRIGDVAIFNSVPGHPHGHIQVLTERGWVSDFKQRDQYPGPAYRNRQAPMQLYRAE
ncbi:hypothetical protein FDP41_006650 [Naegleria fowleri]|uniref:Peptidase C51 domain-containing protein n=1 Tax=Naegleria fowleri TaxID=5763 RepID=A0A6A5BJ53_NAEFO|nr:uncharacterized protein FDP41_006650 [Naegleria fowleri]KAF0974040.1 hypothetical protein FDP41_006650 [Naegleria fowleri]